MPYRIIIFISFLVFTQLKAEGSSFDSIRMEIRNGKKFVIHKIEQGETLYGLSKRYKTTVAAIIQFNKQLTTDIQIGQELIIPYATILESSTATTVVESNAKVHIVDIGESVYGISKKYNLDIKELQQWNNLGSFNIKVGQKLFVQNPSQKNNDTTSITSEDKRTKGKGKNSTTAKYHVVQAKETLFGISKRYNMTVNGLQELNKLKDDGIIPGQRLVITYVTKAPDNSNSINEVRKIETKDTLNVLKPDAPSLRFSGMDQERERTVEIGGITKKFEEGFGAVIESNFDTDKYLVLHKSAPLGTIVQIRNLMTRKSVTARVVGKLPPTGNNKDILIRLSKITFERLGGIDRNIPVEVSFIP